MESYEFTKNDILALAATFSKNVEPQSKLDHFLSGALVLGAVLIHAGSTDLNAELYDFAQQICTQAGIKLEDALAGICEYEIS